MQFNDSNELTHWGIQGMKWGRRRFQNKDGSLTPAGRKRYNQEDRRSADAKEAATLKKKKVREMSNAELRKLNERQQLERTHSNMNKGTIAKGLAVAGTVLAVANTIVNLTDKGGKVIDIGKNASNKVLTAVGEKILRTGMKIS